MFGCARLATTYCRYGWVRSLALLIALSSIGVVIIAPPIWTTAPWAKEPKERLTAGPTADQLKSAEQEVRSLFRERLARAVDGPSSADTARFLLEQSNRFEEREDLSFAALSQAAELAEQAADLPLIAEVYRNLGDRFDVDAQERHARALNRLVRQLPAERFEELGNASLQLFEQALADSDSGSFDGLESLAQQLVSRSRNTPLNETLKEVKTRLATERRNRDELAGAQSRITSGTARPSDRLTLGSHLCTQVGDWDSGLQMLAAAEAGRLSELAELDRKSSIAEAVALGDQWFELAQRQPEYQLALRRAEHWYRIALPTADAVEAVRLEDRLASIAIGNARGPTERSAARGRGPVVVDVTAYPTEIEPTFSWTGHQGTIWSIAVSPNGQRLATAGDDREIAIWDLSTRERSTTLKGSENTVLSLSFSADGKQLLSGGMDDIIRLWSLEAPGASRQIGRHDSHVRTAVFDQRQLIVSASDDRSIAVWHPQQGLIDRRRVHEGIVYGAAVSDDGNWLATVGEDRWVKLWSPNSAQPQLLSGHEDKVRAVAFEPGSQRLVTASEDQTIRIWPLGNLTAPLTIKATDALYGMAISPDSRWIAAVGRERVVRLWSLADGTAGPRLVGPIDELKGVVFGANGDSVFAVGKDSSIYQWNLVPNR